MGSIAIVVPERLPMPPVQGGAVEQWCGRSIQADVAPKQQVGG